MWGGGVQRVGSRGVQRVGGKGCDHELAVPTILVPIFKPRKGDGPVWVHERPDDIKKLLKKGGVRPQPTLSKFLSGDLTVAARKTEELLKKKPEGSAIRPQFSLSSRSPKSGDLTEVLDEMERGRKSKMAKKSGSFGRLRSVSSDLFRRKKKKKTRRRGGSTVSFATDDTSLSSGEGGPIWVEERPAGIQQMMTGGGVRPQPTLSRFPEGYVGEVLDKQASMKREVKVLRSRSLHKMESLQAEQRGARGPYVLSSAARDRFRSMRKEKEKDAVRRRNIC